MAEDERPKGTRAQRTPSPSEMLTAHLLAMLKGWSGYGYELAQRLEEAGLGNYNSGTIYRTLRQMEKLGLVSSLWDTSEDGPARRMYTLTGAGNHFLKNWIDMLEWHQTMLQQFMRAVDPTSRAHTGTPKPKTDRAKRGSAERTSQTRSSQ